jgi:hypothetical protein
MCIAEKIKLISDVGDCGSKKYKEGYGGVWLSYRLAGVGSDAVGFVLVCLATVASVAVKMFSRQIYL